MTGSHVQMQLIFPDLLPFPLNIGLLLLFLGKQEEQKLPKNWGKYFDHQGYVKKRNREMDLLHRGSGCPLLITHLMDQIINRSVHNLFRKEIPTGQL